MAAAQVKVTIDDGEGDALVIENVDDRVKVSLNDRGSYVLLNAECVRETVIALNAALQRAQRRVGE